MVTDDGIASAPLGAAGPPVLPCRPGPSSARPGGRRRRAGRARRRRRRAWRALMLAPFNAAHQSSEDLHPISCLSVCSALLPSTLALRSWIYFLSPLLLSTHTHTHALMHALTHARTQARKEERHMFPIIERKKNTATTLVSFHSCGHVCMRVSVCACV